MLIYKICFLYLKNGRSKSDEDGEIDGSSDEDDQKTNLGKLEKLDNYFLLLFSLKF